MARIAVFIDHDIVIRNFLMNGVLQQLANYGHDLLFVFPEQHRRVQADLGKLGLSRYRTIRCSERRLHWQRLLYHVTILKRLWRRPDSAAQRIFWHDVLGWKSFWWNWYWSWPLLFQCYRAWICWRMGPNPTLDALLEMEQPELLLHPTVLEGLFVTDLIQAGKRHGIPTLYLMNSWDNPSCKAMLAGFPDCLAVWGQQSKLDAIRCLGMPAYRSC